MKSVLLLLLFLGAYLASMASIQDCRSIFSSDKDYMKQKYLQEHRNLQDTDVGCDSWGCHNTSGCCYNNGYYYGSWWWVWIVFIFCFFFIFIAVGVVIFASSGPWFGAGYGPGYGHSSTVVIDGQLVKGGMYRERGGKLVYVHTTSGRY